jgi:hypothetical protein
MNAGRGVSVILAVKLRALRCWLRGPARRRHYSAEVDRRTTTAAYWLVRGYYIFLVTFAFRTLRYLYGAGLSGREIDPLWPIFWIDAQSLAAWANLLAVGFVAAAIAAVVWPDRRAPKLVVAVLYLFCLAFENSFGSINHFAHFGLWVAICFAALPSASLDDLHRSRCLRQQYVTVFFLAQCLIGLFYSMSGLRKFFFGFYVPEGAYSSFAPEALPAMVVQRWLQTDESTLLAQFFLENLWMAQPAYLAVIYLELFTLVAVFRPELHRLWGVALVVFHIGVWMLIGISFDYQPMLVALLYVASPFAPQSHPGFRRILRQLPGFGDLVSLFRRPRGGEPARAQ